MAGPGNSFGSDPESRSYRGRYGVVRREPHGTGGGGPRRFEPGRTRMLPLGVAGRDADRAPEVRGRVRWLRGAPSRVGVAARSSRPWCRTWPERPRCQPGQLRARPRGEGGAVTCWGHNGHGQLGDGTVTMHSDEPVDVVGLTGAVALASGPARTCALLSSGRIKCWGSNVLGGLGDGTNIGSAEPVEVVGIADATAIAGGGVHSCAVVGGGNVQCWGNNDNWTTRRRDQDPSFGARRRARHQRCDGGRDRLETLLRSGRGGRGQVLGQQRRGPTRPEGDSRSRPRPVERERGSRCERARRGPRSHLCDRRWRRGPVLGCERMGATRERAFVVQRAPQPGRRGHRSHRTFGARVPLVRLHRRRIGQVLGQQLERRARGTRPRARSRPSPWT